MPVGDKSKSCETNKSTDYFYKSKHVAWDLMPVCSEPDNLCISSFATVTGSTGKKPCVHREVEVQAAGTHLDGSIYLRGSDIACLVEGAADPFNNVYKDLVSSATISALSVQHRLDDTCRAFANCVEKRRRCCLPLHAKSAHQHLLCVGLALLTAECRSHC